MMTAVTAATAWRVSKSDMWKLRLHTLGFIKSKDIYGGGEIKQGMRENESLSELGLLTADNVSPSGASTVIHHLRRYNRSWPRVTEPPEGRIDCDERAVCLLLQCIDIVTSEWDFNSSSYHFTSDLLHYSYVIFMMQFQVQFSKKSLILGDHKYKYTVYIERDFRIKSHNFKSEVIGNKTN